MRFQTRNSMIDANGRRVRASGDRFDMGEAIQEEREREKGGNE